MSLDQLRDLLDRHVRPDGTTAIDDLRPAQRCTRAMPLDSYVTLGRSGVRVSPLTLGAMTFGGDHGWGCSPDEAASMMSEYIGWSAHAGSTSCAPTSTPSTCT
jgi:hypothetical protein